MTQMRTTAGSGGSYASGAPVIATAAHSAAQQTPRSSRPARRMVANARPTQARLRAQEGAR